ncbi:TetR/AcrR family transcriptional regulator [Denitromonas iodatirespirans]|uniref:TetR/AcrR family transcriptional regulator n=1 Tax=Denitromonas iodatirespirans TaxID=2795389 RepID=A0A944DAP7_DENI1|nr:TetR/AcrR family transcriptional regulator [Denitromonas iodatirespirans]MBT0961621.1 TetR/AcrR family transcriptional regulator [Denitromonas iodatirespirans]
MPRSKPAGAEVKGRPDATVKLRRLHPRRTPNQARSRDTVQAVLRAAGDAIERDGLDRLTTRRIAALAGISVGALYEYFPNKQAVVYALVTDWMERVFSLLDGLHPVRGGAEDILSYLGKQIDQMADLYRAQPGLGALITMVTSVAELRDAVQKHDERCEASVASALQYFAPEADAQDVHSAARTIAIIAHEILCEAVARNAPDADRLMRNLKICVFALGTRLLLPR